MRKIIFAAVVTIALSVVALSSAHASVFLDFESPAFSPNTCPGNYDHSYIASPYGNITFNGRIWDHLNGIPCSDKTTGSGYFLKNVIFPEGYKVTMNFDFDVDSIDLYWLGVKGVNMHGAAYDINGDIIGEEGGLVGSGQWIFQNINRDSNPIRSIAFWSNDGNVGNLVAVDNMTINPSTPEPASLLLLGIGLIPVLKRFKRS